jgi:hypothetical protein
MGEDPALLIKGHYLETVLKDGKENLGEDLDLMKEEVLGPVKHPEVFRDVGLGRYLHALYEVFRDVDPQLRAVYHLSAVLRLK